MKEEPKTQWSTDPKQDPDGKNICYECGGEIVAHNICGWGLCQKHWDEEPKEYKNEK